MNQAVVQDMTTDVVLPDEPVQNPLQCKICTDGRALNTSSRHTNLIHQHPSVNKNMLDGKELMHVNINGGVKYATRSTPIFTTTWEKHMEGGRVWRAAIRYIRVKMENDDEIIVHISQFVAIVPRMNLIQGFYVFDNMVPVQLARISHNLVKLGFSFMSLHTEIGQKQSECTRNSSILNGLCVEDKRTLEKRTCRKSTWRKSKRNARAKRTSCFCNSLYDLVQ